MITQMKYRGVYVEVEIKYQLRNGNLSAWKHGAPSHINNVIVMQNNNDMDIMQLYLPANNEPVIALGYVNEKEAE